MIFKTHKRNLINRFLISLLGAALMTAAPLIQAERSYVGTWGGIYKDYGQSIHFDSEQNRLWTGCFSSQIIIDAENSLQSHGNRQKPAFRDHFPGPQG